MKAKKPKKPAQPDAATAIDEAALLAPLDATRGAPANLRPAGPMEDRRTKRRRTRAAAEHAAIDES